MNTQNIEIRALSDDELDAVSGGEPISQAVGLMVSLAQATIGGINYGLNYLNLAAYLSNFGKGMAGGLNGLTGK
jgi:hypothetical protein